MPEIVIHFDAGADAAAVAKLLQVQAGALEGVSAVETQVYPKRGTPEIVAAITVATGLITSGALALDALRKFIDAAKGVGTSLGLGNIRVEIGSRVVAPEALTHQDVIDIERGG